MRQTNKTDKKVMASVFWGANEILLIDYLEKCKIIYSDWIKNSGKNIWLAALKKTFRGKRFSSNEETISTVHQGALHSTQINTIDGGPLNQTKSNYKYKSFILIVRLKTFHSTCILILGQKVIHL